MYYRKFRTTSRDLLLLRIPMQLIDQCGFIRIFLFDFVFSSMPLLSFKIKCIYSTYNLIFMTSKRGAAIRTCLCTALFNSKFLGNLCPSSSIVWNEVYITISSHNNQPNILEKDANLLCSRSSRQRNFNHPPFYCEFMACIVLIVHVFLPLMMQTYSHRMFILLPLPRLLSS